MSFDFFAEHKITEKDVCNERWEQDYELLSRVQLLANSLWDDQQKEADISNRIVRGQIKNLVTRKDLVPGVDGVYRRWIRGLAAGIRSKLNEMESLGIPYPQNVDWSLLPSNAWLLTVDFRLSGHLMTKDDNPYYIIENPVCKDTAFKVPMMRPSSWKGYLRWACVRQLAEDVHGVEAVTDDIRGSLVRRRVQLSLLFGNERSVDLDARDEQGYLDEIFAGKFDNTGIRQYRDSLRRVSPEGLLEGKLHFYPTFFDKIDLDIINPHDPEKKSGENPILMEIVPGKQNSAQGKFVLLYAPLYHGYDVNCAFTAKEDLIVVVQALEQLMLKYGFSAKRTSGYGIVKEFDIQGSLKSKNLAGIMPGNTNLKDGNQFPFKRGFGQLIDALK